MHKERVERYALGKQSSNRFDRETEPEDIPHDCLTKIQKKMKGDRKKEQGEDLKQTSSNSFFDDLDCLA